MTKPKTPSSKEKTINDERVKVAVQVAQGNPSGTDIGYMPAVLCHVFFPYHDPGAGLDLWYRKSGNFILSVESTASINPITMQPVKFGIPSGPKPRLILATLNNIALLQQKPELYLGHSLTEFIGQHLKLNTDGRTINEVKSQLARLSTAHIQIAYDEGHGHAYQDGMRVIRGLDVWWGKDKNQRHLWGNYLRFSSDYFNALQEHGVPLDMRALRAMSNNPVAIDLYSFLAHRLHNLKKPVSISWAACLLYTSPSPRD